MFPWNLRYVIYFRKESSVEDAACWMLRVPLFREVRCIIRETLGIRWDGMGRDGNSLAEYASEASERVFSLSLENLSEAKRAAMESLHPSSERGKARSLRSLATLARLDPGTAHILCNLLCKKARFFP